jgi:RHH-type proline utilization regulon transcriptional repressor/proline dehydrogenase/delta 1-pyrroline-5-carboxylate dehydrogenase
MPASVKHRQDPSARVRWRWYRRAQRPQRGGALDAFLREYSLASREGVILMCLAEALLRIPDGETADRLIADKIPSGAGTSISATATRCWSTPRPGV